MAADTGVASGGRRAFDAILTGGLMVDTVYIDYSLDFRTDAVYGGFVVCNGLTTSSGCPGSNPIWIGAMLRLTTNDGNPNPDTWGIASGGSGTSSARIPTAVLFSVPSSNTKPFRPVPAAPPPGPGG